MSYTIKGKVVAIMPTKSAITKDGKSLTTRDIVIKTYRFNSETGERELSAWNTPKFEARDEICNQINSLQIGNDVDIQFNVTGVSYTDKMNGGTRYFTTLRIIRIAGEAMTQTPPRSSEYAHNAGEQDRLPF